MNYIYCNVFLVYMNFFLLSSQSVKEDRNLCITFKVEDYI
jgi:hypothetical protein